MAHVSKISTVALRFLAASTIALGLVPLTYAHEGMECAPHFQKDGAQNVPPHFKALNLTQDQQEKLRAISAAHQEVMQKNMELMRANRQAEKEVVQASSFDEYKAQKLAAQDARVMEANNLATLRFRHELYQILTPEQRTKFDAMRNQRHDMMQKARKGG
jgi:protein CpxP